MIDNSGAITAECINVIGKRRRAAGLGDEIVCVVKSVSSELKDDVLKTNAAATGTSRLKKGDVVRALVARVKFPVRRPDGTVVSFDDNAVVLTGKTQQPLGTAVLGVVARECNKPKWQKVISITPRLI